MYPWESLAGAGQSLTGLTHFGPGTDSGFEALLDDIQQCRAMLRREDGVTDNDCVDFFLLGHKQIRLG